MPLYYAVYAVAREHGPCAYTARLLAEEDSQPRAVATRTGPPLLTRDPETTRAYVRDRFGPMQEITPEAMSELAEQRAADHQPARAQPPARIPFILSLTRQLIMMRGKEPIVYVTLSEITLIHPAMHQPHPDDIPIYARITDGRPVLTPDPSPARRTTPATLYGVLYYDADDRPCIVPNTWSDVDAAQAARVIEPPVPDTPLAT